MSSRVFRVGILGATDALDLTFLPTLHSLTTLFNITTIHAHDGISTAEKYQKQLSIPHIATSADEVLHNAEVDLVLNLLPFEYHEKYTIAALEAGKNVMVEAPLSLSIHSLRRINAATKTGTASNNNIAPKVFVGCARRYAPCFTDVFKKEIASLDRVQYARCRNIAGPSAIPAVHEELKSNPNGHTNWPGNNQSNNGTKGSTNGLHLGGIDSDAQFHKLMLDIFESTDDITPDRKAFCRFLGSLGCYDLSLMREALGLPDAVANVSITDPFYSTIFHYTNVSKNSLLPSRSDGLPFTVMYETGIDAVPRSDAHLTVYGRNKTVSIEYDMPGTVSSMCKEGSMRVVVEEADHKVQNGDGPVEDDAGAGVKRTEYKSSFAEAYERQFLALHAYIFDGPEAKTSTEDALMDLRMLHMIFDHYDRQCGTIRTPLG